MSKRIFSVLGLTLILFCYVQAQCGIHLDANACLQSPACEWSQTNVCNVAGTTACNALNTGYEGQCGLRNDCSYPCGIIGSCTSSLINCPSCNHMYEDQCIGNIQCSWCFGLCGIGASACDMCKSYHEDPDNCNLQPSCSFNLYQLADGVTDFGLCLPTGGSAMQDQCAMNSDSDQADWCAADESARCVPCHIYEAGSWFCTPSCETVRELWAAGSPAPSVSPTKLPTKAPTKAPTDAPTDAPTMAPSPAPTKPGATTVAMTTNGVTTTVAGATTTQLVGAVTTSEVVMTTAVEGTTVAGVTTTANNGPVLTTVDASTTIQGGGGVGVTSTVQALSSAAADATSITSTLHVGGTTTDVSGSTNSQSVTTDTEVESTAGDPGTTTSSVASGDTFNAMDEDAASGDDQTLLIAIVVVLTLVALAFFILILIVLRRRSSQTRARHRRTSDIQLSTQVPTEQVGATVPSVEQYGQLPRVLNVSNTSAATDSGISDANYSAAPSLATGASDYEVGNLSVPEESSKSVYTGVALTEESEYQAGELSRGTSSIPSQKTNDSPNVYGNIQIPSSQEPIYTPGPSAST